MKNVSARKKMLEFLLDYSIIICEPVYGGKTRILLGLLHICLWGSDG